MIVELIPTGYTYNSGREAINYAFSAEASFNSFSAETMVSGTTNLYDIFVTDSENGVIGVAGGTNVSTGGTVSNPIINLDDNITLAGAFTSTTLTIGSRLGSSGLNSGVIGSNCTSNNTTTFATGYETLASGKYSFAGGYQASGISNSAFAFGTGALSSADNAVALGYFSVASGQFSGVFSGRENLASGDYSVVIGGYKCSATTNYSFAGGNLSQATGSTSFAFGTTAKSYGTDSVVIGGNTNTAIGQQSAIIGGQSSTTSGLNSAMIGCRGGTASHDYSIILGCVSIDSVAANTVHAQNFYGITAVSAATFYSGSTDLSDLIGTGGATTPKAFQSIACVGGGTSTWDYSLGYNANITLTGNTTLSITNSADGDYGTFSILQDGVGGRTITLPAGDLVVNGGGGSVVLSPNAGDIDILSFVKIGPKNYWNIGYNYTD